MTETETHTLMGPGEVLRALGVAPITLKRWRDAGVFPKPLAELEVGPVWDGAEVLAWHENRSRDARARAEARANRRAYGLAAYRRLGNVSAAARETGIARSTLISWLEDEGEPLPRQ